MMGLTPKSEALRQWLSRSGEKRILIRHGHIVITNYDMGQNPYFEKTLSKWDKMTYKYQLVGGYYIPHLREFRINRGFDQYRLRRFFPDYRFELDNNAYPTRDEPSMELTTAPKNDFQQVALAFMAGKGKHKGNTKYSQFMIDADTGDGKAQPDMTPIPTPTGTKRLGDIKVGDEVFAIDGTPTGVLGVYPQDGLQETYRVTLEDGRFTECNLEHLWYVNGQVLSTKRLLKDYTTVDYYIPNHGELQYKDERLKALQEKFRNFKYEEYITPDMKQLKEGTEALRSLGKNVGYDVAWPGLYIAPISEPDPRGTKIVKIQKMHYLTQQRCIYIEHPSHVYITENCIPTHNTYCGVGITAFFQRPTVVIVPFTKLLNQWRDSFINFTTITADDILIVKGSKLCEEIRKGKHKDKKVFIFSVDTIASYKERYGNAKTIDMLYATEAYTKIVDEVHKDIKAINMIEALSNFQKNYYMSASPGRADEKENYIFEMMYANVARFGSQFKARVEKHLNIMVKYYSFIPTMSQVKKMYNPKVGLNPMSYERELVTAAPYQRSSFEDAFRIMLQWTKKTIKDGNKILILGQTITFLEYLKDIVDTVYDDTAMYHGSMKPKEKEAALEHTAIVATTKSLGTGADIPGLQFLINCTTYSNKIDVKQISGRLRKIPGTEVAYIEMVNNGYNKTMNQYLNRKKHLIERSRSGKIMVIN